jgi:hypothetical protein
MISTTKRRLAIAIKASERHTMTLKTHQSRVRERAIDAVLIVRERSPLWPPLSCEPRQRYQQSSTRLLPNRGAAQQVQRGAGQHAFNVNSRRRDSFQITWRGATGPAWCSAACLGRRTATPSWESVTRWQRSRSCCQSKNTLERRTQPRPRQPADQPASQPARQPHKSQQRKPQTYYYAPGWP